jgi:hypothetical protein
VSGPTDTVDSITLPPPTGGKAYNKIEVMNIMLKVPVGHVHICATMLKAILAHQKQYDVSCSKTSIY